MKKSRRFSFYSPVLTRAVGHKARILVAMASCCIAFACSLESTLDSLASQFPKHKYDLNRLLSVSQALHAEVGLNAYSRFCDSSPCVSIGGKGVEMSLEEA